MTTTVKKEQLGEWIGKELGPSDWFVIDQDRIDAFAEVTQDYQFIHIDPEAAKETPFGSTIAHGFLSLSMLSYFAYSFAMVIEGAQMSVNYGFDRVRFIQPVAVGSEIRARATILSIEEKKPGQFLLKYAVTVDIKGQEKPALLAEWLGMQVMVGERG